MQETGRRAIISQSVDDELLGGPIHPPGSSNIDRRYLMWHWGDVTIEVRNGGLDSIGREILLWRIALSHESCYEISCGGCCPDS